MTDDLGFIEMQERQNALQQRYKDKWTPISPDAAKTKLLWLMIELGEVADVIKKEGSDRIMTDGATRGHFVEEMCDVLMYYNDVMLCYNISPEELRSAYIEKIDRNMNRW